MVVTKIEPAGAKYKVYIDGAYAFLMYKKELSRYRIETGQEMEEEVYCRIRTEVVGKRAKLRALHLLNDMGRTEQQLRQKLERDGYPEDLIEEAVSYVKSFGYINDDNYARIYINGRKDKKSRKELYAGLLQRGIDKDVIERALELYYEESDAENAIAMLLKKKHYDPEKADRKETQRLFGYLTRKGFECGDIFRVSEKLDIYDKTV